MFYVYIVRCADGTLYTGYTINLKARVEAHNLGRGAKYTRSRRPVAIVYSRGFRSLGKALTNEYATKQLSRPAKEVLITRWCEKSARRRSGADRLKGAHR